DGLALTLPPRQYELVATILADAIVADPTDPSTAAREQAAALGHTIGTSASHTGNCTDRAVRALADLGYEPRLAAGAIVLDNCPFHTLAVRHTALICGLNVDLVAGVLAGLGCDTLRAELQPRPGCCCVGIRPQ